MKTHFLRTLSLALLAFVSVASAQVVPIAATQAQVDAGTNRTAYVTPLTLANWSGGGGGGGAPTTATYITQTPNASLSNEQALSALASGIMRVANGTGVITSLGDVLPVPNGGTGIASGTSGGLLYFSSGTTIASSGAFTANTFLTGGGAGNAPVGVAITGLVKGNGASAPAAAARSDFALAGIPGGTFAAPTTTDPYGLTAANSYGFVLFYGATGEIDLPAGATGMNGIIYNTGAFTITIDPNGSEIIVRDGTAQSGGVSMTLSSGAGNYVALVFDGSRWVTLGYKGTLAAGS